jgi:hypothetical protein
MSEDQNQQGQQDQNGQQQDDATTPDTGGQSGQGGQSQGVTFTVAQQEYLNKLLADERRNALRRFKESDEFKNISVRAQQANEVDELRSKVQRLESEKAGALVRAESVMASAHLKSEMLRRGIADDRIDDALILADKSNVKVNWDESSVTGVEDAVQLLVESRPWIVGGGVAPQSTTAPRPTPNLNGGNRGTTATEESKIQSVMEEMAARGLGRI